MTKKFKPHVLDYLEERGYVEQATHLEDTRRLLNEGPVTFYIGFDATAESLHVGHLLQINIMHIMQEYGHKPIVLLGGGTTMVGDPSGRNDMRQMMTPETIRENTKLFRKLFSRYLDFSEGEGQILNNADWLLDLNYVEFLREIGPHFSVNRMLGAESYKARLETGLTFLEFNYMIMQAYDFLHLFRHHNCIMQFGGNDQWSNIIAGVDLIRRKEQGSASALAFTLLTTSDGVKMGKTAKGALWLDAHLTSPYEFYQYWRNIEDASVVQSLLMMTRLSTAEIKELAKLQGADINKAKEILAFEVTAIAHGKEEAQKAQDAARALFADGGESSNIPHTDYSQSEFAEGKDLLTILTEVGLIKSRSEGRRLIEQNGLSINGEKEPDWQRVISLKDFQDGKMMIQKGRKIFHEIRLEN